MEPHSFEKFPAHALCYYIHYRYCNEEKMMMTLEVDMKNDNEPRSAYAIQCTVSKIVSLAETTIKYYYTE